MFGWQFIGDRLECDVIIPPEPETPTPPVTPPSGGSSGGGSSGGAPLPNPVIPTVNPNTGKQPKKEKTPLNSAPSEETAKLLTQVTPTGNTTLDGNPIYKVANPLTENICTDLVKVYDVEELLARDTKGSEFKGYIDILTMFRALEKDEDVNGPTFTLYKNDGVVLNNDLFNG